MKYFSRSGFLSLLSGTEPVNINTEQGNSKQQPVVSGKGKAPELSPLTDALSDAQLLHLIRRTLFGVTVAGYSFFKGKTLSQCLDVLLTPSPTPLPPVNTYSNETLIDADVPFGKTWVFAPFLNPKTNEDGFRVDSLKSWWIGLMINQDHSLTEKMTVLWSNHLAVQIFLTKDSRLGYLYLATLRRNCLGNFKKLVREITTDPGMLLYLNGNVNTAAAPNENFARELQELFTAGKGPDSHYTESDVKEAARVLTGWDVKDNPGGNIAVFNAEKHDTGKKQFSAFYDNHVIEGRAGEDGAKETDELINMIFRQREVAKYVCRNLYRWFVYYKIDEAIEANIITPLADIFIKSKFEIIPVLRALLGSKHFFDAANMGCQIKSPIDHTIGACRQLQIFAHPDNIRNQYLQWSALLQKLIHEGMEPGDPPQVAGWPAYYQIPTFAEAWINATTLTERNAATDDLVRNQFDLLAFTEQLSNPGDVNELIAESCRFLSAVPFAVEQTAVMKRILLSGQDQDHYWADAWNDYTKNKKNDVNRSVVLSRLVSYYSHVLQRSEYQLN